MYIGAALYKILCNSNKLHSIQRVKTWQVVAMWRTFMPLDAIVPQHIDAVRRGHVEVDMFQIQQSCEPHSGFHVPPLNTTAQTCVISVLSQ